MWISRKLGKIHQELVLLAGHGKAVEFLANAETAQKISDLVDDIREVMMDYQVRVLTHPFFLPFLTNTQTSLQQDIYDTTCRLIVGLTTPPSLFS